MMDEQTALVLSLQLVALFGIAGALVVYLLCKIRPNHDAASTTHPLGAGKAVLLTSADTAIGLQIALHLADRGFRVFAGLKDGAYSGSSTDTISARIIRAWQKNRESSPQTNHGALVALPFDVTREDLLHEAVDIIRAHLPAGEDGIWAVINTSSLCYRGRLEQQDIAHWDAMFKTNVIGVLRTARTFQGLLRNTSGRLLNFGYCGMPDVGLVAYTASRYAVDGASEALRNELINQNIKVVTLHYSRIPADILFVNPKFTKKQENEITVNISECTEYYPVILTTQMLQILDTAITCKDPKHSYELNTKNWLEQFKM